MKILYIDNKQKNDLFIFPGFSFDIKIFSDLDLKYNLLYYNFLDDTYIKVISSYLKEKIKKKIYLLGWSLGCFILNNVLSEISFLDKIKKIFLISCSEKFLSKQVTDFSEKLSKNKEKELTQFYRKMFFGDKEKWYDFQKNYLSYYLNKNSKEQLLKELHLLQTNKLSIPVLNQYNITLIHSQKDIITSYDNVLKLKKQLKKVEIITNFYCHAPFLYPKVIHGINKG